MPADTMRPHRWFAAAYDRVTAGSERSVLAAWRRELLAGLTGDILEIGAGTGANFQHYPPGVRVIALEPDPAMLQRAQHRLLGLGRHDIDVRLSAAESLPFDDASFDAVVSTLVLCTVDDPQRSLAEIRRVLRRDGKLVFIEHVRGDGMLARIQDLIRPAWSWTAAGCHPNRPTRSTMEAAGFDVTIDRAKKMLPILPLIGGTATPR